jgi:hypothetical protein
VNAGDGGGDLCLDGAIGVEPGDVKTAGEVELCFTPTYCSWGQPDRSSFRAVEDVRHRWIKPPNHTVATRALHAYLRWHNANARHPDVLPPNASSGHASAANATTAGDNAHLMPPDQPRPTYVATALVDRRF